MTNFEKIQAMTAEEMEQFLVDWVISPKYRVARVADIEKWLESEAKE